jgi:hypothetical protein
MNPNEDKSLPHSILKKVPAFSEMINKVMLNNPFFP